jgi:methionine-rich copper-binding protein CopC
MRSFDWKSATLLTLASMATAVVIQACGHDDGQAVAQTAPVPAAPDPIEGTFQSEVTIKDCTTGATVTGFRGYTAFHQGGTATADNNMPPPTKGVAVGVWKRTATGSYTVNLRFARVLASGAVGQQRFTRAITLAPDGNTLTSTISAQVLDPADNVVQTICGVETGARFQ